MQDFVSPKELLDSNETSMFEMTERNPENGGLSYSTRFNPSRTLNSTSGVPSTMCNPCCSASVPCNVGNNGGGGGGGVGGGSNLHESVFERQFLRTLNKVHQTIEKNEFRLAEQDRKDSIKRDWQQVALVVDRVLLFIFMVTTLSITAAMLLHAPHARDFLFGSNADLDQPSQNDSIDGATI